MFSISQLNEIQILVFALILLRMTAFVVSAAVLSSPSFPVTAKILFSVVFTMLMFKTVATNKIIARVSEAQDQIILLAAMEVVIGLCLGFLTRIYFFAISMAGELISVSMGLGQAQMFNPMMGNMGNAIEQFLVFLATLLYFAINGHHNLIYGLAESFNTIEIARLTLNTDAFASVVYLAQKFFVIGIQISAPVLISMVVVQVGVGLLSRAVPQINVLTTTASITVALGFVILFISLPLIVFQLTGIIDLTNIEFFRFVKQI
jgi:flagellar biosynthesis protein FliR